MHSSSRNLRETVHLCLKAYLFVSPPLPIAVSTILSSAPRISCGALWGKKDSIMSVQDEKSSENVGPSPIYPVTRPLLVLQSV